jgi:hypothetical protein
MPHTCTAELQVCFVWWKMFQSVILFQAALIPALRLSNSRYRRQLAPATSELSLPLNTCASGVFYEARRFEI